MGISSLSFKIIYTCDPLPITFACAYVAPWLADAGVVIKKWSKILFANYWKYTMQIYCLLFHTVSFCTYGNTLTEGVRVRGKLQGRSKMHGTYIRCIRSSVVCFILLALFLTEIPLKMGFGSGVFGVVKHSWCYTGCSKYYVFCLNTYHYGDTLRGEVER